MTVWSRFDDSPLGFSKCHAGFVAPETIGFRPDAICYCLTLLRCRILECNHGLNFRQGLWVQAATPGNAKSLQLRWIDGGISGAFDSPPMVLRIANRRPDPKFFLRLAMKTK